MARNKDPRKVHRYSAGFKLKGVKLSDLAGVQVKDVAEALEIHPFMLSRWRRECRHGRLRAPGWVTLKARERREIEQLSRLKREYALLREEQGTSRFYSAIPNRVLGIDTTAPWQVWVGDVTYLRSAGRWRYLAVVLDRHSPRVLGWAFRPRRDLTLTRAALNRALLRQPPRPARSFTPTAASNTRPMPSGHASQSTSLATLAVELDIVARTRNS